MKISVVIPTLNRRETLRKVFEDLRRQSYTNFEVVILDGGSTDGTQELCCQYENIIDICFYVQQHPGIVVAMNEALSYCKGDVFTRTDDDVALSKDWLKEIVAAFVLYPDAGGVTGPTVIPRERRDNRDLISFNERLMNPRGIFWKMFRALYHGYFMEGAPFAVSRFYRSGAFSLGSNYKSALEVKGIIEVDYLESCNWSMKIELIRHIGGFDERYGGVSEYFEADMVFRIKRLGFRMYFNPLSHIQHLVDRGGNFKARSGTYGRAHNFILFYLRNIKPDTTDKAVRFLAYVLCVNIYFVYCFVAYRQLSQLSGIAGTFVSLVRYFPEIFKK